MPNIKLIISLLLSVLFWSCNSGESRLQIKTIHSAALEQSLLKVNPEKKIAIYLPPSYFESDQSYPVVYYLPGFTSPIDEIIGGEYEGFRLKPVMDELIEQKKIREMIIVLCDGSNYLGGNFYYNSPLTGRAEDFIVQDVVGYVDKNYRTLANSSSRGITGHSMGGFGSFNIASKHPDIFGLCYSISPGIYAPDGLHNHALFDNENKIDYLNDFIKDVRENGSNNEEWVSALKKKIKPLFSISYESYLSAFTMAYSSAFLPDTDKSFPYVMLPDSVITRAQLEDPFYLKWQASGFGNWPTKILQRKNKLLQLNAIAFDCGKDDAWITEGTAYLLNLLNDQDIPSIPYWHEGSHDDQLHLRWRNHMLPFFSERMVK